MRSYAVIGTGGIGGYYGALLQKAGHPVHFLARSDYKAMNEDGLSIRSINGNFRLRKVSVYRSAQDLPACDTILITVKSLANASLGKILPPLLREKQTSIVLMQNGYGEEQSIAALAKGHRLYAGLCFICSTRTAPGRIRHLDYGRVKFAPYARGYRKTSVTPELRSIADDFKAAGLPVTVSSDLKSMRWQKLVWNIPFSGLTALYRTDTHSIVNDKGYRKLAEALMKETVRGAEACGAEIPDGFTKNMMNDTLKMKPYQPSMLIDLRSGREMEVETIFGNPLRAAHKAGAGLPLLAWLYGELSKINMERHNDRIQRKRMV